MLTRAANAADDLQAKMSGVESVTSQAAETAKTTGQYWRSLDDVISNLNVSNLWGAQLRGQFGEREQFVALNTAADTFGMTITDVRTRVDAFIASLQGVSAPVNGASGALIDVSGTMQTSGGASDQLKGKLKDLDKELKTKKTDVNGVDSAFKKFGAGLKAMFPTISGLLKRFKNMIIMRSMRYMIRAISKGFSEGVQNVYQYSNAIGGSFATSMDSAASSLLTMKNSLGAAVAPVIQALIPYLQTVVNWFISLVNYANQFFALLNGQSTWTHAVPATTTAFNNQANAAHNAANAMKDLLADWDELNIIQSESGNGGSNSGVGDSTDYTTMFEEVSEFNSTISDIVNGIKDTFGDIWGLVKRIGAIVFAWKLSKAFTGIVGTLAGLVGSVIDIALVFELSTMFTKNFLNTGNAGWLVADILTTLVGGVIAKKLLGKVLGGALANVAIPLTFAVSAAASIKALVEDTDVSGLSEQGIATAIAAALEGGVAAGTAMYYLVGTTASFAAGVGAGNALFTFGLAVGIKAIAETVDAGEITSDVLKEDLISSATIGAGVALSSAVILGSAGTVGSIVAAGTGAALFTFGMELLIEAIIAKQPKRVGWGNKKMTKDEIQAFITKTTWGSFDLEANMELAAQAVSLTEEKKEDLKTKVRQLIPFVDALVLGVDTEESAKKIDELVHGEDGVIKKFEELQRAKQDQLTLAFASIVFTTGEGSDSASEEQEMMKTFGAGWNTMNRVMENLGSQLSTALKNSYDTSLKADAREMAKQTVVEITQAMAEIEAINTSNQTAIQMRNKFSAGLSGISQDSMSELLEYYKQQQAESIEFANSQYQTILDEAELQQMNFLDLAQKAQENGGEFGGFSYEHYMDMYKQSKEMYEKLKEYRDASVAATLAFYKSGGEGYEMIRKEMLRLTGDRKVSLFNMEDSFFEQESALFAPENTSDSVLQGENAKQNIQGVMEDIIRAAFNPQDWPDIKAALDAGVITYSDFINEEMMTSLANELGIKGENRDIWNQYVSELLGANVKTPSLDNSELDKSVKSAKGTVSGMVDFVKEEMKKLSGIGFDVNATFKGDVETVPVQPRASGGFIKSGDLIMANENGNIEMMGKMGSQPVVANNQQIVSGISQGVAEANGDVVGELRTLTTLMQRMLNKEFVAKAVPGSDWGRANTQSQLAYDRVTG